MDNNTSDVTGMGLYVHRSVILIQLLSTWDNLRVCNRAHSGDYMCGLTSSGPLNATCRNSGTYYGPSFWPPALPGTILAWRHWWLGCSPCQYKTPISQWGKKKKKKKNTWTQLPQKELVSLNDWRMLAELNSSWHFKKHSKNFRGIQCKDLKHLTET